MNEKTTPTYALDSFKAALSSKEDLAQCITFSASKTAHALGFGPFEVLAAVQAMERKHFYKSMTSLGEIAVWQNVYHVPYSGLVLYVKFRADVITEFQLLSFKGK